MHLWRFHLNLTKTITRSHSVKKSVCTYQFKTISKYVKKHYCESHSSIVYFSDENTIQGSEGKKSKKRKRKPSKNDQEAVHG